MFAGLTRDTEAFKAQLRSASLILGQSQGKKDSEGYIARKDIAILLKDNQLGLARTKARRLLQEDAWGDLLETLGLYLSVISKHVSELSPSLSNPDVVEAASGIIFAAPHVNLKELSSIRATLIHCLGPAFAYSAIGNYDKHVAPSVVRAIHTTPPSIMSLNSCLKDIALSNSVDWSPELPRQERVNNISEILDMKSFPIIEIPELRRLCSLGLPDEPSWLRPRVWKLLFGILPPAKASWKVESDKQRESYYTLVRRLLEPISTLPPASHPSLPQDLNLLNVLAQLSRTPVDLFHRLDEEPEREVSSLNPVDPDAADNIAISCARNLTLRLDAIHVGDSLSSLNAPEIRLEVDDLADQKTLFSPQHHYLRGYAHPKHLAALLRLFYIHVSINPANLSPFTASLLVSTYSVLNQEIDIEELAHVEADSFWLFEALIGELSDLDDEAGLRSWMRRFSERLAKVDRDLWDILDACELDPAEPHYSSRWLSSLFTQTLPTQSLMPVWDVLFSRPTRERDMNFKLDYALNICIAMLLCIRNHILQLARNDTSFIGNWLGNGTVKESKTTHVPLGDPLVELLALLQRYPIERAGGIDLVLQTALDISMQHPRANPDRKAAPSITNRLTTKLWKGFTNQLPSPELSPTEEEIEDGDLLSVGSKSAETPETTEKTLSGFPSRLATTVWRGITNQTAMEVPPSPMEPIPVYESSSSRSADNPDNSSLSSDSSFLLPNLWNYAQKLKDSDTAAAIAKASTNLQARALGNSRGKSPGTAANDEVQSIRAVSQSPIDLSPTQRWSSPLRSHFTSPRSSLGSIVEAPSLHGGKEDGGFLEKTKRSFASLTKTQNLQPAKKSAPRPLILGSVSPIISPPNLPSSRTSTPDLDWADMKHKHHARYHRDSQSSVSSLSFSDHSRLNSARSDPNPTSSQSNTFVPLNRRSISPMAPGYHYYRHRPQSASTSSENSTSSSPSIVSPDHHQGRGRIEMSDPVVALLPQALNNTPESGVDTQPTKPMQAVNHKQQVVLEATPGKKLSRKRTISADRASVDNTSGSSAVLGLSRSPRIALKRSVKPLNLNNQQTRIKAERKTSPSNSLMVEWPTDEQDIINTPRASSFATDANSLPRSPPRSRRSRTPSAEIHERSRKMSSEGHDTRVRKVSNNQRVRKTSNDNRDRQRKTRDSSADEGDDEGYDELLSAYESEDGPEACSR